MSFGSMVRMACLAVGLIVLGTSAASACDNCERHDGWHEGYRGGPDGWRDGDGYRDGGGWHEREGYRDNCRGDGCGRYAEDCRDHCYRHDDCRDRCGRRYEGCHDGCGRCHDGCGYADNYSCRSGFHDCRFEGDGSDDRFRERYYDGHPQWVGGGAYGFYGH
jgi:hypothetical protein